VVAFCREKKVSIVVVGPEAPLAAGLADTLLEAGLRCFGPTAAAAKIECDKEFAKTFMDAHGIPTAKWQAFTDAETAKEFIAL
jgi:phosphoribosylamine-glycine ligase